MNALPSPTALALTSILTLLPLVARLVLTGEVGHFLVLTTAASLCMEAMPEPGWLKLVLALVHLVAFVLDLRCFAGVVLRWPCLGRRGAPSARSLLAGLGEAGFTLMSLWEPIGIAAATAATLFALQVILLDEAAPSNVQGVDRWARSPGGAQQAISSSDGHVTVALVSEFSVEESAPACLYPEGDCTCLEETLARSRHEIEQASVPLRLMSGDAETFLSQLDRSVRG